jgi:hypothetical protein
VGNRALDGRLNLAVPPEQLPSRDTVFNHFWPRITLTYGLLSVALTLAAMRLVQPAGTRLRLGRLSPRRRSSDPEMAEPLEREAGREAGVEEIGG